MQVGSEGECHEYRAEILLRRAALILSAAGVHGEKICDYCRELLNDSCLRIAEIHGGMP